MLVRLFIFVLASGITICSNGNNTIISDCFKFSHATDRIVLTNAQSPYDTISLKFDESSESVVEKSLKYPYLYSINAVALKLSEACSGSDKLCCICFDLVQITDANYKMVPNISLKKNEKGKWKISQIYFHD